MICIAIITWKVIKPLKYSWNTYTYSEEATSLFTLIWNKIILGKCIFMTERNKSN